MAAATKDTVLSLLTEIAVNFKTYEHPPVSNVEEQAKYLNTEEKGFTKNLLLKDKKGRVYLISALTTTNIDLKMLSQRLGLGKGGLHFSPEDVVRSTLQVPLSCVAPFTLMNESARQVTLFLDNNFRTTSHVFFHPLTSNMTISIEPCGLDSFLHSINREAYYVDLEAVVLVGKDQPPDLAVHVPSDLKDESKVSSSNSAHMLLPQTAETNLKGVPLAHLQGKEKAGGKSSLMMTTDVDINDVQSVVDHILRKTVLVISEISGNMNKKPLNHSESDIVGEVARKLSPEFEHLVMMFKNTAYTQGFMAGMGTEGSCGKGKRST